MNFHRGYSTPDVRQGGLGYCESYGSLFGSCIQVSSVSRNKDINPRFRLIRYYSICSAVALGLATAFLVNLYRVDQEGEFLRLAEEDNLRLATAFGNTFWRQFEPFFIRAASIPADRLRERGELQALDIAFGSLAAGLPILKIRALDSKGVALYSSVRDEVGLPPADDKGVAEAFTRGWPVTRMTFMPDMPARTGRLADRWVVVTLMPVKGEAGHVSGGLELTSDVTPAMARMKANAWRLGGIVTLVLTGLYGALFLIVRRADRIISVQHAELERIGHDLRIKEERFRSLAQTAAEAIISIDQDGRVVSWNQGAESIFGWSEAEMQGQNISAIMPESQREAHRQGLRRLRDGEEARLLGRPLMLDGLRRDGEVFPVELTLSRWVADGEPYFSAILRDVTERRLAERELAARTVELERSNSELQQFAYVASHDLQEPLRTVTSFLQLLERRLGPNLDDNAREYIGFAVGGAARMHRLITDLLTYSRVSTHGQPFKTVSMEKALAAALANLGAAIREAGAEISHGIMPDVRGDPIQLVSLLQNLLGNAIKYRVPGTAPHVHVEANGNGDVWTFSVKDNGIGIDPKDFERIFVIFQRLHGRNEYEGTGIGLAVAKKIVERHGGAIWVESQPGQGSTFFFTLPVQVPDHPRH